MTKQGRPDYWKSVALEQLQTLIESIVDVDLSLPSDDRNPSRPAKVRRCDDTKQSYQSNLRSFRLRVVLVKIHVNTVPVFVSRVLD